MVQILNNRIETCRFLFDGIREDFPVVFRDFFFGDHFVRAQMPPYWTVIVSQHHNQGTAMNAHLYNPVNMKLGLFKQLNQRVQAYHGKVFVINRVPRQFLQKIGHVREFKYNQCVFVSNELKCHEEFLPVVNVCKDMPSQYYSGLTQFRQSSPGGIQIEEFRVRWDSMTLCDGREVPGWINSKYVKTFLLREFKATAIIAGDL